ncbi:packaged DNA stabilization gp4 family protein [Escherichia coli]|uniref:packaged DNA stabilization gp4 family protein n=1 Tax=Escherichia coli TaxID=562 RepID=UPI00338D77E4
MTSRISKTSSTTWLIVDSLRYPNRMPVGSGNQLAKWNGWNYFHRKEPCDNGSE